MSSVTPSIQTQKSAFRTSVRHSLQQISPEVHTVASDKILTRLVAHPSWHDSHRVLFFWPLPDEPDLRPLLDKKGSRQLFLPKIQENALIFFEIDSPKDLEKGPFELLQPKSSLPQIAPEKLDLICVPGLAFSLKGARLGRGKGFYDRLLASPLPATRIGICFHQQLFPTIPTEPHDCHVHHILTEYSNLDVR